MAGLGQRPLDTRRSHLQDVRRGAHRVVVVERPGHRGGRSSDGVELDPTVLVDDHPQQPALSGRCDDDVLEIEAGARHHRSEQREEGLSIR